VHLKIDTGMHRSGCAPADAVGLAQLVRSSGLRLDGVFTHLAVADVPDDPFTDAQLDVFDTVLTELRAAGIEPGLVHAANSAGALAHARARRDVVRAGIAIFGISPGAGVDSLALNLSPALALRARVSTVRRVPAGERISYGLRHQFAADTTVAVIPVGYADGLPRRSFECGVEIIVGGRRRPIVGIVTMDQVMVDVGNDDVRVGDDVVLIGAQGSESIAAAEWAERLGTIGYEVVCGISSRVPRIPAAGCDDIVS
jgi:alanine racemase